MAEKKEKTLEQEYICLTTEQANKKIEVCGLNAVEEEKRNPVMDFLKRFWGPIPWMLEFAALLEIIVGITRKQDVKFIEAAIILALLIFNSIMSFMHEGKAQKALELLKQRLSVKARVMRDDKWTILDAKYLVPDDIVHLRMGDFVPADIKILDSQIQLDQSALTGESLPIEAETGSVAYSGSVVKRGEATGIVMATGKESYFGKTAELVKIAKTKSNLSKLIFKIVKYMMYMDFILLAFFLIYALSHGFSPADTIVFILVILIAAIPIALPATYTLSTALGAVELSKKGVLTTKLSAIEESAAMTVLCSDKTGTLTENKVILEDITPVGEHTKEELLTYSIMASDEKSQDALDDAIFKVTNPMNLKPEGERASFTPFDPATKRTEGLYKVGAEEVRIFKGQPATIWNLTQQGSEAAYKYENIEKELAQKGERVLATAYEKGGKYEFLGFLGFMDPERPDSKPLVQELRNLGVRVIMLTGDTAITAKTIAKRLDIGEKVCERKELIEMSKDKEKEKKLADFDVFGGIYPEDKYNIVKALQDNNYIVGMTGDGVNDSPALKQAEVGIAVSGSTDVAKAAASIVLTDPGLSDIVSAIKTSREIFQRMSTWVLNKIAKTIEISFFTIFGIILINYYYNTPAKNSFIITPVLVILLLFTNDFVTMSISTDNVKHSLKPNEWKIKNMVIGSVAMGVFQLIFSFGALVYYKMQGHYDMDQIATIVFLIMVFTGQGVLYLVITADYFYKSAPSKYMIIATIGDLIVVSLLALFGISFENHPLIASIPLAEIIRLYVFGAVYLFLVDIIKVQIFRKYNVRP